MDNLNKLLKYLVNTNDIEKLASDTGVDASTIEKVCVDIFTKLIPSDFTRSEGAHIEKKDLTAITTNFNNLLSGAALKELIGSITNKYGVDSSKASLLVKQILVIIRSKLQFMSAAKKPAKPVDQRPRETVVTEPKETIKKELVQEEVKQEPKEEIVEEENKVVEEVKKPLSRIEKRHPVAKQETNEAKIIKEEVVEEDEEDLSKGEKIALYVVGGLLVAVIVVIIIVLVKVNM